MANGEFYFKALYVENLKGADCITKKDDAEVATKTLGRLHKVFTLRVNRVPEKYTKDIAKLRQLYNRLHIQKRWGIRRLAGRK